MVFNSHIASAARLPNTRRPDLDVSERQRLRRAKFERYRDAPIEEDLLANDNTKKHREWLMGVWREYFQATDVDPDSIWIGLCEGDGDAVGWCKTFFSDYVEDSVRRIIVLGPEEYADKRMLNCASSVLAMWRKLVKEADVTVLRAKRQEQPSNAEKYRLRFFSHTATSPKSSVSTFDISLWIWKTLAVEAKLSKELTFDKVEATAEDVIVILHTLWDRAADMAIDAKTRVAFHANVLIAAMGGFRSGCLGKTRYRDIVLSVVRDQHDRTRKKHVATTTMKTNKMQDSLSSSKTDKVAFSTSFVPFPLVCLTRLIIARAIKDNAFEAGYTNEEEVMERPALGDVDFIALKWKDEVLDQVLFDLSYRRFTTIWRQVCQLAGFRVIPRLYALRVGAAARLDKDPLFSRALCNYVLKHTTAVFEASYQPSRLREDLTEATFGERTGSNNSPLFVFLRNISMTRDANAPFELGPDDWADFDKRTDVCTLQCAIAKAKEHGELDHRETLRSRLKYLRSTWGTLKRADNRRRYFEEADRARSQGQQPPRRVKHTTNHAEAVRSCRSGAQMANQVLLYFDRCWNDRSDEMSGRYLHLLVVYLMGGSKARLDTWEEEEEANKDELMQEEQDINYDEHSEEDNVGNRDSKSNELHTTNISMDDGYFECVLCDLRYSSRTTLTGHYDKHVKKKFFEKPLQCPICRQQQQQQREKMNVWVGEGFPAWLNHLEQCHGKRYTPYFRQDTSQAAKYPCPFANCVTQRKDKIFNSRGLSNHVFRSHAKEHTKDQFKTPIICRYCTLPGDNNSSTTILKNIWDWKQHFTLVHEEQQQRTMFECYICSQLVRTAGGLKSHFSNLHERKEGFFERPFTCPECVKLGKTNCATMSSRKAWQDHIDQYHDGGAKRPQLAEFRPPEYRCLVCLQQYSTRENLSHHLKLAHTELFTVPFQCPACVRQGKQDTEIFDSQVAWTYHTWRYHRDVILSSTSDVDSPESSKIGMSECEDLACVSLEGRNSQLPNISTTPEDELTWSGVVNIVPDVVSGTDKLDGLQNTPLRRMRGSCKRKRDSLKEDQAESRNKRCGRVSAVTIPIDPALLD